MPKAKISQWERDLNIIIDEEWWVICKRTLAFREANLRAFHIQFLHKAFHMNVIRSKYTDCSDQCTFCNQEKETYMHLFWDCLVTRECWVKLIEFCEEYICLANDVMSKENCILSNFSSTLLVVLTVIMKTGIIINNNECLIQVT